MALAATRAAQLTTTGLESLGWTDAEAAQVAAHAHVARVFAVHRSDIEVRGPQGLDRIDRATAGGLDGVAVGDWLELTDAGGVARILERRNAITRKAAGEHVHRQVLSANVDRLISNDVALLRYPSAAATSVVLLLTVLITIGIMLRFVNIRKEL